MSRGYGRGSIVSFIVVGLLLTALVLGGLYVVKNQLDGRLGGTTVEEITDKAVDNAKEVAKDATDTNNESQNKNDENKPTDNTDQAPADQAPDQNTDNTEEAAPANDSTPQNQPAATSDDDETATDDATDATDTDSQELATTGVDTSDDEGNLPTTGVELPQTGLGDTLLAMIPLTALIAAFVAYRRSNLL